LNKTAIAENRQKISSLYSKMASNLDGSMPNLIAQTPQYTQQPKNGQILLIAQPPQPLPTICHYSDTNQNSFVDVR
jgi:hypothetical protein